MAGTLPVTDFVKVTLISNQPGQTSMSISGKRQTKQYATQFWQFNCDYRTLQRADAARVMAFIAKQRNNLLDFDLEIYPFSDTAGTVTAMLAANPGTSAVLSVGTNASAGASSVSVSSAWNSSKFTTAGVSAASGLRAGDFITFSNHYKAYQITDDVSFNGSGAATINLYPNLVSAVTTSHTINYSSVLFHVFLLDPSQQYEFGMGDTSNIQLRLQESW